MSESEEHLRKVELLRKHLNAMVSEKTIRDPEVLALSQLLDQALNEYMAMLISGSSMWKGLANVGTKLYGRN